MAREFKETAHLRTNKKKYDEGYERIFGKKKSEPSEMVHCDTCGGSGSVIRSGASVSCEDCLGTGYIDESE